jgi:DNA invertase Pin-like site-specific DNA recombinase
LEADRRVHRGRPQLRAAQAACKKHKAKLVIAKLDRLSRNVAFIANLLSRICNGLGIMRQCLETQTLDRLGERLDQLEGARGESVSYGDTKHHQSHQVAH